MAQDSTQEWIKKALRASRMSAAELARQTGVSRQAVSRWLHPDPVKRTTPEERHIHAIAEATGVEYGDALKNSGPVDPPSAHAHSRKTLLMRDAMRIVRKQHPELMENFDRVVEIPGARLTKFDYASGKLVMCATVGAPRGTVWHLALLARADQQLRNDREVVLCHAGGTPVPPGELRLMGVTPVPVSSAADVAFLIVEAERR